MKNIYPIVISLFLLISSSVFGQDRIYAPSLNEPENGDINQPADVLLNWSAVTGESLVILYEVQLSLDMDFSDPITFPLTDITSLKMNDLIFGEQYYWRVRAYDDELVSDWSVEWSFSVLNSITLDKPNDNSMVYADPMIQWDAVSGLSLYQLQLDSVYDWKPFVLSVESDLLASFIMDENNQWIAGGDGMIIFYNGMDWVEETSNTTENINDLWFTSTTNGYAVGDGGLVLHYNGADWSEIDLGVSEDFFGIHFIDENMGWVVGADGIIFKYDNGNWLEESASTDSDLYDVFAVSSSNIWVCGNSKTIGQFNGTDWNFEEISNRDYYSIWFTSESNGWVVGKSGKILYYNGSEWQDQSSGTTRDLFSVCFSASTGYAVGKSGTLLQFDGYWFNQSSGSLDQLESIFVTDNLGLIVGEGGTLVQKSGEAFTSPFLQTYEANKDSAEYQLEELLFGTDYYFRIRGLHGNDTTAWSGARKMTTYANTELDSPSNESENNDLLIEFTWDEYEGVTNYILEVDSNENFNLPRTFGPDENHQVVNDFVFGTEYFWRVKAQHFKDISDWSETWSLTTTNTIILTSPENEATNVLQCPRYTWEEVRGASKYHLWIDTDMNFSDPVIITADTSFYQCQSALERETLYYWKVRGQAGASFSDWSEVWSFETEGYDGVDENLDSKLLQIYPNPSDGVFTVQINSLNNTLYELSIVDLLGKELYKETINCNAGSTTQKLNLQHLEKGIYLVHVRKGESTITKKLFIK